MKSNYKRKPFTYKKIGEVTELYQLDLNHLYADDQSGRERFEERWGEFYEADPTNADVFRKEGDVLVYKSEILIPEMEDGRPSLLLAFGNPAPHSVKAGMFFSYEGSGSEHRIWKALRETGILTFNDEEIEQAEDMNAYKRDALFSLNYDSPFRIGLVPFYAMSSPASGAPWTGISGMRRLFGSRALDVIAQAERKRILGVLQRFMPNGGSVLAFQKDAYEYLRNVEGEEYSKDEASQANLVTNVTTRPDVQLACSPPTRLIHAKKTRRALAEITQIFLT